MSARMFLLAAMLSCTSARSDLLVFEGSAAGTTTGELLEGISGAWATNAVLEIPGLEIRARTGGVDQLINANNGYFGINSSLPGERADAFDAGETLWISFDRDIRIDRIDFNLFDSGESFGLAIDGQEPMTIGFGDLSNQSSDWIDFPQPIVLGRNKAMALYAAGGTIGLDGMEISVIPEPAALGLLGLSGFGAVIARRWFGRARTSRLGG